MKYLFVNEPLSQNEIPGAGGSANPAEHLELPRPFGYFWGNAKSNKQKN